MKREAKSATGRKPGRPPTRSARRAALAKISVDLHHLYSPILATLTDKQILDLLDKAVTETEIAKGEVAQLLTSISPEQLRLYATTDYDGLSKEDREQARTLEKKLKRIGFNATFAGALGIAAIARGLL